MTDPLEFVRRTKERLATTGGRGCPDRPLLAEAVPLIELLVAERDAAMHMVKKWMYSHSNDALGKPRACRCELCTESHAAVATLKGNQ